jgi:RNA polymerase sigma factor (sigma-70 family)
MARGETSAVLRDVHTLFDLGTLAGLSDRQLLDRFAGRADANAQAAFAGLVARHGPMVLGVCRRALNDPNDVNDAFQATFLVLVRKAKTVRVEGSLGRWLYGVSRRVSARAKAATARRSAREVVGVELVTAPDLDPAHRELGIVLDEEIGRLPERFRSAVVLCDMGGLSYDEAAEHLGCAVGTLKSRLSRAREKLRSRLTRRGFAPSAIAAGLGSKRSLARVPEALAAAASCSAWPAGEVSAAVEGLAREVLRAMFIGKLKMTAMAAVTVASLTASVGVFAWQEVSPAVPRERQVEPAAKEAQLEVKKDADKPAPPMASGRGILRPFTDRAWWALFSPDGKSLVAGTNTSGGIRAYELATHKEIGLLDGEPKTKYGCAAFSPDGKFLATSGGSKVLIWDFADRRLLTSFEAHPGGTRSLAFSPDSRTLASGGDDRTAKLWEAGTWARRSTTIAEVEPVFVVAFSPDGRVLAVATGEFREARAQRVTLYDYDVSGAVKKRVGLDAGRRGPVWTLAFSPDGRTLASAAFEPQIKLWDSFTGRELATLRPEGGITTGGNWARGLAFTADSKTLAAGQSDGTITLWDVASGRQTQVLPGHEDHLFTVAVSPDGKTLAGASKDGSVGLWDLVNDQR